VTDLGSSNGTTLNGEDIFESRSINDGDVVNLGGGLEIEVKIKAAEAVQSLTPDLAAAPEIAPEHNLISRLQVFRPWSQLLQRPRPARAFRRLFS
jgi:pSer/pThr/pTyr-binding forkhead associated (FHA) protein